MNFDEIHEDERKLRKIKDHVRKIEYLRSTGNNLLYWDKVTNMPAKGIEYRAEVMSFFAGEIHRLSEDRELIEIVDHFSKKNPEELDMRTNSMIRKIRKNHDYISRIPVEEYKEYINLIARAEEIWSSKENRNNFDKIKPYLEKIILHMRNFSEYWGYEDEPYDALLAYYDTGVTVKQADEMFAELKGFIINMLDSIGKSELKIDNNLFNGFFPKEKQREMSTDILERLGFDFDAGRLDEGVHPTILVNSSSDVRIITSYREDDFRPALTTALHEGGQGLYEQGIDSDLRGMLLAEPPSMVILEAVARFYENILGRSRGFWEFYYPKLKSLFPSLEGTSAEDFYRAVNAVEPSFVRMDADELTYNLHIIIRYEIEKELINGSLRVEDLPEAWNRKYMDYLGICPPDDRLGVLQDVHWFSGYFGYFPSYVVGNMQAAQIHRTLQRELDNYEDTVREGRWHDIKNWLEENVFRHGSVYDAQELIYLVTDENLKSRYYIDYLRKKYSDIYKIQTDI